MKPVIRGSQILTRRLLNLREEFARMQTDKAALHPLPITNGEAAVTVTTRAGVQAGMAGGEVPPAIPRHNQDSKS